MKVSYLTSPNPKGQVVIPKVLRDALRISPETTLNMVPADGGLYLYPISEVVTEMENESAFMSLLKITQGAWGKETDQERKNAKKRVEVEKQAAQQRKAAW